MIKEAIILAGGLGTRLRSVVDDRPKCMALIHGKPFLHYLIRYLQQEGIEKFIFSVGYMHEVIEEYLHSIKPALDFQISLENEPLGTGGGIQLACRLTTQTDVIVCNGDTLYKADISTLADFHKSVSAGCTLTLKPMKNFDRYGVVELNNDQSIFSFKEKRFYENGLINGGIYALNIPHFLNENLPEKFSFEKDYLEPKTTKNLSVPTLFGCIQDAYFIDIGIPEDYEKAEKEIMQHFPSDFF
ncbi:MAG: nucleotidyltransferase family protein [Ginsengibacter sp.]